MIERSADALRVTVPMTIAGASRLLAAGCAEIGGSTQIFDLAAVTEVDSSALAVMLAWQRKAAKAQGTVQFVHVPAGIRALADLYGIDELLQLA